MKRRHLPVLTAAALGLCACTAFAEDVVKVGVFEPLTGANAAGGAEELGVLPSDADLAIRASAGACLPLGLPRHGGREKRETNGRRSGIFVQPDQEAATRLHKTTKRVGCVGIHFSGIAIVPSLPDDKGTREGFQGGVLRRC